MSQLNAVNELQIDQPAGIIPVSLADNPDAWFEQKFNENMQRKEDEHTTSMAIVVTKGTLDWAYPPFILARRW